MSKQLHKKFTTSQLKDIFGKFDSRLIDLKTALTILGIKRSGFYKILAQYKKDPENFSVEYKRKTSNRTLDKSIQKVILDELKCEKEKIIDNPKVPTTRYNYTYVKNLLSHKHDIQVSVPTIIKQAKLYGFYKARIKSKIHDREVLTNYAGELIQHDSSYHLFAPDSRVKWKLITSLDDHSRKILFGDLYERETTTTHIHAFEHVALRYGLPLKYYVDQHSIFRYVHDRDKYSLHMKFSKFTDDTSPQWKQVLESCNVEVIYALSAQAKGKVERPYQWLQDHLVRTCVREGITKINDAKIVLKDEIKNYNSKRVHSTTGEIPDIKFNRSLRKGHVFREFEVPKPYNSIKDVFCLRINRIVNAYRKVSLGGFEMKVPKADPKMYVQLHLRVDEIKKVTEVRFWHKEQFLGHQIVKSSDLTLI